MEVYNLCCLHFHRLTVHVNTRIVFFMKLLLSLLLLLLLLFIIILIILIIKFFTRIELLVYCNVFKTPISKRMLNLCQIDSKNTTPGQEHF